MGKGVGSPPAKLILQNPRLCQRFHHREAALSGQVPFGQGVLDHVLESGKAESALHVAGLPKVEVDRGICVEMFISTLRCSKTWQICLVNIVGSFVWAVSPS